MTKNLVSVLIPVYNVEEFVTEAVLSILHQSYKELEIIIVDGCYADLQYTRKENTNIIVRKWKSKVFTQDLLKKGWMPAHPTLVVKSEVYKKFGIFNTRYQIAADYEFILRILNNGISTSYIPQVLYKMRLGGASNRNINYIIKKSCEDYHALREHKVGGLFTLLLKNMQKIIQFF